MGRDDGRSMLFVDGVGAVTMTVVGFVIMTLTLRDLAVVGCMSSMCDLGVLY